ncbi:MAG: sugar transferase [Candidatus Omnitrophica bacterium]|nr:sugar transferase [Candidatus Omnitrophota bacterium]
MGKKIIFLDGIVIFISFVAGYYFRFFTPFFKYKGIPPFQPYLKLTIFIICGWILIFNSIGLYKEKIYQNKVIELSKVIEGSFWAIIFLMAGTFLYRGFLYSRLAIGFSCIFSLILLSVFHSLFLNFFYKGKKKILIFGESKEIDILKKRVILNFDYELKHIEKLSDSIEQKICQIKPDFLIVTKDILEKIDIKELTEKYKLKIYSLPKISEKIFTGIFEDIDGLPLISVISPPINKFPNYLLKRIFDLIFGFVFLLIFSILLPFVSFFIKIDSKGPIFFKQKRIGKDGKVFFMWKFRTMKYPYLSISPFTLKDDPRLTKIGKFLRRYNIDELPQIFNVLKGDMSLIGPRPISEEDKTFIELPQFKIRLSVKPGITGWAQIHGLRGGNYEPEERIRYDIYYIQNWNIFIDFAILICSFFSFKNAY